jgi:hypothetical protein
MSGYRAQRHGKDPGGETSGSVLDWNEPAIGTSPVSGWTVYRVRGEGLEELAGR